MLKNIVHVSEAKSLTKEEQKSIQGGAQNPIYCNTRRDCFIATGEFDWACQYNVCIPL